MNMSDEQAMTPASSEYDNLEEIDGIGPGYAKALQIIGIHSFADLAHYGDANQLRQALLEHAGKDVPLSKIEKGDWLGQAKRLAESQASRRATSMPESETQAPAEPQRWRQYAGFSLFFDSQTNENGDQTWQTRVWRTRAYHDESGEEVQFAGIEASQWARWILEQAGLPVVEQWLAQANNEPPDSGAQLGTNIEVQAEEIIASEKIKIEIADVQVSEVAPTSEVPEKQLQAQMRIVLSGPEAERAIADKVPLRVEVHLIDLESGASTMLAARLVELESQVLEYLSRQLFSIPAVGRYRLHCLALLLPPAEVVAFGHGPILNIVP
jgi:hypothetical protein